MNDASSVRQKFRLEEATIDDLHRAIQAGETTVVDVVKRYIERVRAFNGVASLLVTEDGAPVDEAKGAVRAGAPLRFPTQTVKASAILPDLDKYLHYRSIDVSSIKELCRRWYPDAYKKRPGKAEAHRAQRLRLVRHHLHVGNPVLEPSMA